MKETPIIFKAEMVRAIREGRKTQTRRLLKFQPLDILPMKNDPNAWVTLREKEPEPHGDLIRCRFGVPGDILWVKETWGYGSEPVPYSTPYFVYRADGELNVASNFWRSSMFMPRKASRITLEIVKVRVERLQAISEADAQHEGWDMSNLILTDTYDPVSMDSARQWFKVLWDSIYATPKPVYTTDDNGRRHIAYYESFPWEETKELRTYRDRPWFVTGNPYLWALSFNKKDPV